jgi:hypothetical protein
MFDVAWNDFSEHGRGVDNVSEQFALVRMYDYQDELLSHTLLCARVALSFIRRLCQVTPSLNSQVVLYQGLLSGPGPGHGHGHFCLGASPSRSDA